MALNSVSISSFPFVFVALCTSPHRPPPPVLPSRFPRCPLPLLTNSPDVFAALRLHQLLPVGRELLVRVQGDPVARAGPGPGPRPRPREHSRAGSRGEAVSSPHLATPEQDAPLRPPRLPGPPSSSCSSNPPPLPLWALSSEKSSMGGQAAAVGNLGSPPGGLLSLLCRSPPPHGRNSVLLVSCPDPGTSPRAVGTLTASAAGGGWRQETRVLRLVPSSLLYQPVQLQ